MIRGVCAGCGSPWKVPGGVAGRTASCPACGAVFDVPLFVPGVMSPPSAPAPFAVALDDPGGLKLAPARRPRSWSSRMLAPALIVGCLAALAAWVANQPPSRLPGPVAAIVGAVVEPPERRAVVAHLKKYSNDPASFEVVEWGRTRKLVQRIRGVSCDTVNELTIRTRNNVGALIISRCIAYTHQDQVVYYLYEINDSFEYLGASRDLPAEKAGGRP